MEVTLNQQNITFIIGLVALINIVLTVYNSIRKPQIRSDSETADIRKDMVDQQRQISEIKETHLRAVETDVKTLTTAVNTLALTMERLRTIIDERIPKGSPGLTPPGS